MWLDGGVRWWSRGYGDEVDIPFRSVPFRAVAVPCCCRAVPVSCAGINIVVSLPLLKHSICLLLIICSVRVAFGHCAALWRRVATDLETINNP